MKQLSKMQEHKQLLICQHTCTNAVRVGCARCRFKLPSRASCRACYITNIVWYMLYTVIEKHGNAQSILRYIHPKTTKRTVCMAYTHTSATISIPECIGIAFALPSIARFGIARFGTRNRAIAIRNGRTCSTYAVRCTSTCCRFEKPSTTSCRTCCIHIQHKKVVMYLYTVKFAL